MRPSYFFSTANTNRAQRPDRELIESALTSADNSPDHEKTLARLRIALRELMAASFTEPRFAEYRVDWNRALGAWEDTAAWYGLYADIFISGRAAVGSADSGRRLLCESPPAGISAHDFLPPATGLATATYSIAKLAARGRLRDALFVEAPRHLDFGADNSGEKSDILALRGSIRLRNRYSTSAVRAYEECLRLRQKLGWGAERIGDSMSELGFAYLFTGAWITGAI